MTYWSSTRTKARAFPEEDKDKVFEKGFGKGTGLGLFLIREILGITGIEIHENGIPGHGTRFEIRVPQGRFRVVNGLAGAVMRLASFL